MTELNSDKENKHTTSSQVLLAGNTSVVFTGLPTTGTNLIRFYNDKGIPYTAINTLTQGQVTLNFEEQVFDLTIYCEIKGV